MRGYNVSHQDVVLRIEMPAAAGSAVDLVSNGVDCSRSSDTPHSSERSLSGSSGVGASSSWSSQLSTSTSFTSLSEHDGSVSEMLVDTDGKKEKRCISLTAGFTEMHMKVTQLTPDQFYHHVQLHCRGQLHVSAVTVRTLSSASSSSGAVPSDSDSQAMPALFQQYNFGDGSVPDQAFFRDLASYRVYRRAALNASDDGELAIDPNRLLTTEAIQAIAAGLPHPHTTTNSGVIPRVGDILVVRVYFEMMSPVGGVRLCTPQRATDPTDPVPSQPSPPFLFTEAQPKQARLWFPTLDLPSTRMTFDLFFTVPAAFTVVSCGRLVEQVYNSEETEKTFFYKLDIPTCPSQLSLAVGCFEIYPDPVHKNVTHFCVPGRLAELKHTVAFFSRALTFLEKYLRTPFPYHHYKQVFVEECPEDAITGASMGIFSTHLLYDPTIIDQAFESTRTLCISLAEQWFGFWLAPKNWGDWWLRSGLSRFLASKFCEYFFGKVEEQSFLLREAEWVYRNDDWLQSLSTSNFMHPIEVQSELVRRKSLLAVQTLSKRMGDDSFQDLLGEVLRDRKMTKEHILHTRSFFNLVKKLDTSPIVEQFRDEWVEGTGYPQFFCGYVFNRKKQQFEVALKRTSKSATSFSGMMTVRVHEVDGTYDHHIKVDDEAVLQTFPCYSRIRKSKVKHVVYENGESAEVVLARGRTDIPVLWLRFDPDMEWGLRELAVRFPEWQLIWQLELDRNIDAQIQAIRGLGEHPTSSASGVLASILANRDYFYRVRIEAARVLAGGSDMFVPVDESFSDAKRMIVAADRGIRTNFMNLQSILSFYKDRFYEVSRPAPNDFRDVAEYFVKCEIPLAIAKMRNQQNATPFELIDFLLELLDYNDNAGNPYSDGRFVSNVVRAIAHIMPTDLGETFSQIVELLQDLLKLEISLPSYHNEVACACLFALSTFQRNGFLLPNVSFFQDFLQPGNYLSVRIAAADALLRIAPLLQDVDIFVELVGFIREEENPRLCVAILDLMKEHADPKDFQAVNERNQLMVDSLWHQLVSREVSYSAAYQKALLRLYSYLWASDTPCCVLGRVLEEKHMYNSGVQTLEDLQTQAYNANLEVPSWRLEMEDKIRSQIDKRKRKMLRGVATQDDRDDYQSVTSQGLKLKISRTNQQTLAFQDWVETLDLPPWVEDQGDASFTLRRGASRMDEDDDQSSSDDEEDEDEDEDEFANSPAPPQVSEVNNRVGSSSSSLSSASSALSSSSSSSSDARKTTVGNSSSSGRGGGTHPSAQMNSTVVAPPPLMAVGGGSSSSGNNSNTSIRLSTKIVLKPHLGTEPSAAKPAKKKGTVLRLSVKDIRQAANEE
mmetsp:Transcript_15642/g.39970  ORF Transcript_15642/g.39970 Transcript_15642/m.39970 type:complete len:1340 (+) Transcript_15642:173-4192(+)